MAIIRRTAERRRSLLRATRTLIDSLERRTLLAAVSWDGGAGTLNWTDANNWSGNALPGVNDDVTIDIAGNPTVTLNSGTQSIRSLNSKEALNLSGGTLDVAAASTLASLSIVNGTLTGSGDVTITGPLNWLRGTMAGSGTTRVASGSGSSLTPTGGSINLQGSRRLLVEGNLTLNDSPQGYAVYGYDTARLELAAGGTLTLADGADLRVNGGTPTLVNNGTVRKSGNGDSDVGFGLSGTPTVDVAGSGRLTFSGGGTLGGTATIAAGGTLAVINSGMGFAAGFATSGAGVFSIEGTATFDQAVTLGSVVSIVGGTLAGSGDVTVTGPLNWLRGTMAGSGTTRVASGSGSSLTPTGGSINLQGSRRLLVEGNLTLNDSPQGYAVYGYDTARLELAAGGTLTLADGADLRVNGGTPTLVNNGTVRKSGNGDSDVGFGLSGTPTVDVAGSGRLTFSGGGTLGGTATIAAGGTLAVINSGMGFAAGFATSGAGVFSIEGTATFDQAVTLGSVVSIVGGTLAGSGDVTVTGPLNWLRGTMAGSGTTRVASGSGSSLTPTGGSINLQGSRRLLVEGNLTLNDSPQGYAVYGYDTARLELAAGGTLTLADGADLRVNGGTPTLVNNGTVRKSGNGDSDVGFGLSGTPTVDVAGSGRLTFSGGGTLGGTATIAAGGTLAVINSGMGFAAGFATSGAGVFSIEGTATFDQAVTLGSVVSIVGGTLAGSGDVTVTGPLNWLRGTMAGSGTTRVASGSGSSLTPTGGSINLQGSRRLLVEGNLTLNDSPQGYAVYGYDTARLELAAGGTLTLADGADLRVNGGTPTLVNNGTVRKSGNGDSDVGFGLSGTPTVDVAGSGRLTFSGGGTLGGTATIAAGGTLAVINSGMGFAAGFATSGAGVFSIEGTATFDQAVTLGSVVSIVGGTLAGSGDVTVTGPLNWLRGTMAGSGTTRVASGSGSSLTPTGGSINLQGSRRLLVEGNLTLNDSPQGYAVYGYDTARLELAAGGTLTLADGADLRVNGGTPTLVNNGTVRKSGNGDSDVGFGMKRPGVVRIDGGTLRLPIPPTFADPDYLRFTGGGLLIVPSSLTGPTTQSELFGGSGGLIFNGSGNATSPQLLEVMSRDAGNVAAGFSKNFVYGSISLVGSTRVKLIDLADNAPGVGNEALYVGTLDVPAGTTLDLNGYNVYARSARVDGTLLNGTLNPLPDGGPLGFAQSVPGQILAPGEVDSWTFYGRAGRGLSLVLNPGTASQQPAPLPPALNWASVELVSPTGVVLASANNATGTAGSIVNLLGATLPADGTYTVRVKAASGSGNATGRYVLTAYDASVDVASLVMNQRRSGSIETAYAVDRWTFSAGANTQVRLNVQGVAAGLAFTLVGPGGTTLLSDVTADSDLVNLPTSGQYTLTVRGIGEASGNYGFTLDQTAQATLPLDTPTNGSLAGSGSMQLYKVSAPGGKPLLVALTGAPSDSRNELYLRQGQPPTRSSYNYRSSEIGSSASVLVPNAAGGDWYVLVYGDQVPTAPAGYSIRAVAGSVYVTGSTPDQYASGQQVTMTLKGAGFVPGTSVRLVPSGGGSGILASSVAIDAYSQITAVFNLAGVTQGSYDVRVTSPLGDSDTLGGAFKVTAAGQAKLETRLIMPSTLGRHGLATLFVEYANTGASAMPAPLIQLRSDDANDSDRPLLTLKKHRLSDGFWTSALPEGFSHSVTILGSGAQPGLLNPGERIQVPVYYAGLQQPWDFGDNNVELGLSTISADDTRAMNWSGISYLPYRLERLMGRPANSSAAAAASGDAAGDALVFGRPAVFELPWTNGKAPTESQFIAAMFPFGRPADYLLTTGRQYDEPGVLQLAPDHVSSNVWSAITTNLRSNVGETLGSWVRTLDENAQGLARAGVLNQDISDLWSMEVQQAAATVGPLSSIDATTDAAVATLGIGLSLGRSFGNGIAARYVNGSLGWGWSMSWDQHLEVEADGAASIVIGSGARRRFEPDSRYTGRYLSQPGDTSKLTKLGDGSFDLRDVGGTVSHFNADGRFAYVDDANGNRITAGYDPSGRLQSLTHSSGASLGLAYNAAGHLDRVTDSAGRVTRYGYDASGAYLTSVMAPDGKLTTYTYNTGGSAQTIHALRSVTRGGVTQFFDYDAKGQLDDTYVSGNTQLVDLRYDPAGRVDVDNGIGVTSLYYDHRGLLARVTDARGYSSQATFDDNARLTAMLMPTGESQLYAWDPSTGNLTASTDELGRTTRFAYDNPLGRLTAFTDARGKQTSYAYDAKGNLTSTTYANGSVERLENYTAAGLPQQSVNRRGQAVSYTYTAAGQVDRQTFADGSYADFDYDARGNLDLVTEVNASGVTKVTDYQYSYATDGDRLKKVLYPDGRWVAYRYDAFGRRDQMSDSSGALTNYEFDAAGRLWKLRDGTNNVLLVTYTYDAAGRLSRADKGNGTYTTYAYDAAGELEHLVNYAPGGGVSSRFDYTYDARGRRSSMVTIDGSWTYGYDATGQLTSAVFASSNAQIPSHSYAYAYDAAGNRTSTTIDGVTTAYVVNELNEYTSVGGVGYTYDADGNLTFDGVYSYAYDAQNRLTSVSGPGGVTTYEYNAFGDRTASLVNGVRSEYLLDPTGLVDVVAEYGGAGTGTSNLQGRNLWGLGLIGRSQGSANGLNYYEFDALGSTAAITGSAGTILNRYAYDPFGGSMFSSGSVSNWGGFGFSGAYGITAIPGSSLGMRARQYNTEIGRFTSVDPLGLTGGDANTYRFGANNPLSNIDPTGLWYVNIGFSGGLMVGGTVGILVGPTGLFGYAGAGPTTPGIGGSVTISPQDPQVGASLQVQGAIGPGVVGVAGSVSQSFDDLGTTKNIGGELGIGFGLGGSKVTGAGAFVTGTWAIYAPNLPPSTSSVTGLSNSVDPNEKFGAAGIGTQHLIRGDTQIPYRINFENLGPGSKDPATGLGYLSYATAPAQRVTISDQLSDKLDWSSFRLSEFGFGDTIISVPAGRTYYLATVSLTYNGRTFNVEVEAGIDLSSGKVFASFQSLDPSTGLPPDVLTGFLLPEDGTGRGKGHFLFTVKPKAGLASGTQIRNVALISFDNQTIIATNQIDPQDPTKGTDPTKEALNTIDNTPPTVGSTPPVFAFDAQPHTLTIRFAEDVTLPGDLASYLQVKNLTTNQLIPSSQMAVSYDAQTFTMTVSFPGASNSNLPGLLPDGRYSVTLLKGTVSDLVGNPMAADYTGAFSFLLADLDNDGGVIGFTDLLALAKHYNQTSGVTYRDGDINHDGKVNFDDLLILAKHYGQRLTATSISVATPLTAAQLSGMFGNVPIDTDGTGATSTTPTRKRTTVEGVIR